MNFFDLCEKESVEPNSEEFWTLLKFFCELKLKEIHVIQGRIEARTKKKKD